MKRSGTRLLARANGRFVTLIAISNLLITVWLSQLLDQYAQNVRLGNMDDWNTLLGFAAYRNNPLAKAIVAYCYCSGTVIIAGSNRPAALKLCSSVFQWLQEEADNKGCRYSQFYLGAFYDMEIGTPRNHVEAARLYELSSKQDYAPATFSLGVCYDKGQGTAVDFEKALQLYNVAAKASYAPAQFRLAVLYQTGKGVDRDDDESLKWYRLACEQGYALAQDKVAEAYLNSDYIEAAYWCRHAAVQGLPSSQLLMGALCFDGKGVPKDAVEGLRWYRVAASQNNVSAMFILGECYLNGKGVPGDQEEALRWFRLAASRGDKESAAAVARLTAASR
jgi:TPR repeat protein